MSQASQPVRFGGMGLRRVVAVSLLAFVSSVYSTSSLVYALDSCVNELAATAELVEARYM